MPSSEAHLAQAQQFEATLASLQGTTHFGWILVLRFYVTLHYVEAVLQKKGSRRRRTHETRRDDMWRVPETAAVLSEYKVLEDVSREARYDCTPFTPKDLADYEPVYQTVRDAMRRALGLT